jgi:branched-chain amino acid transport system ATP-binding protein
MLEVRDLHAYYGKSHILNGVHMDVRQGEIVSLLGRNGVGRSTTIKAVMGMVGCRGSVRFKGEEMIGRKTFQIAHKGI